MRFVSLYNISADSSRKRVAVQHFFLLPLPNEYENYGILLQKGITKERTHDRSEITKHIA